MESCGLGAWVGLHADRSVLEELLYDERRGDVWSGPARVTTRLLEAVRRLHSEVFSLDKSLQLPQTGLL